MHKQSSLDNPKFSFSKTINSITYSMFTPKFFFASQSQSMLLNINSLISFIVDSFTFSNLDHHYM